MKISIRKKSNFKQQKGVALLSALILLVMLTILGLSSMRSTTLEERMAANTQIVNRAFQAASTGIEIVFSDSAAFDLRLTRASDGTASDSYKAQYDSDIGGSGGDSYDAVTDYNSIFLQSTPPIRGSGYDNKYAFYYFDLSATGCIVVDATDTDCSGSAIASNSQHQGAYQIAGAP